MIGKKKKITQREIKEDKLVSTFYNFQEFFVENQQKIIIGVGALVVIVLGLLWYSSKVTENNLLAAADVAQIIPIYEQAQYQKAIDGEPGTQLNGLKNIVENYGSTEQGEIAKIYLANSYYALGDYKKAMNYYSKYSGSSNLHKASSYAGQAACYEQIGEFEDAALNYKKAATTYQIESQTADFLLNAGINFIKAGQQEEAKSVLELVKNDYNTTAAFREVDKYLSQL